MHSSRMCTVHLLTISQHALSRGECLPRGCLPGCVCLGDICPEGCLPGGCLLGGVCLGVSAWGCSLPGPRADSPPVDRMTDMCKKITLPQFRFGGNKAQVEVLIQPYHLLKEVLTIHTYRCRRNFEDKVE